MQMTIAILEFTTISYNIFTARNQNLSKT